jgi:hypothetical protein
MAGPSVEEDSAEIHTASLDDDFVFCTVSWPTAGQTACNNWKTSPFCNSQFAICNFGTAPNLGIHGMILSRLNLQAAVVGGTIGQSKISKRGIYRTACTMVVMRWRESKWPGSELVSSN